MELGGQHDPRHTIEHDSFSASRHSFGQLLRGWVILDDLHGPEDSGGSLCTELVDLLAMQELPGPPVLWSVILFLVFTVWMIWCLPLRCLLAKVFVLPPEEHRQVGGQCIRAQHKCLQKELLQ